MEKDPGRFLLTEVLHRARITMGGHCNAGSGTTSRPRPQRLSNIEHFLDQM
jgi:hypothetical protein